MFFLLSSLFLRPGYATDFKCNICDVHAMSTQILSSHNIDYSPTTSVKIDAQRTDGLPDDFPVTFLVLTYADSTSELPNKYLEQTIKGYQPNVSLTCDFSQNFLFVLDKEEYNEIRTALNVKTDESYFGYYENVLGQGNSSLGFLCYDCQDGLIYDHLDFIITNTCY